MRRLGVSLPWPPWLIATGPRAILPSSISQALLFARTLDAQLWADAVHGVPLTLGGSPWWPPLPLSAATAVPVATAAAANPIPTIAATAATALSARHPFPFTVDPQPQRARGRAGDGRPITNEGRVA